jgi:hypothetical protein
MWDTGNVERFEFGVPLDHQWPGVGAGAGAVRDGLGWGGTAGALLGGDADRLEEDLVLGRAVEADGSVAIRIVDATGEDLV